MARRHRALLSRHRLIAAAAVSALLVAGCSSSSDSGATTSDAGAAPSTEVDQTPTTATAPTTTSADASDSAGASDGDGASDSSEVGELFPDVIDAAAVEDDDGTWTFSATLSSPYDTPERYADAWRVRSADGIEYGRRELAHDHANEQPFTRSQSGIVIPAEVTSVIVEGRDQLSGWGGATVEVVLDRP